MSDRTAGVLRNIDDLLATCICGQPLTPTGASLDYCSENCQEEWQGRPTQARRQSSMAVPMRNGMQTANAWAEATTGYGGDWGQFREAVLRRANPGPHIDLQAVADSVRAHISPGEAVVAGPNGPVHIRGAYSNQPMEVTEMNLNDQD